MSRDEMKDLIKAVHSELAKDCPGIRVLWWKIVVLMLLAGGAGGMGAKVIDLIQVAASLHAGQ